MFIKKKKWENIFLVIYDFFQKDYILIKNLGSSVTCISFSLDGKLLTIGTI